MTIYRTVGAWGAGKGANLTPAEVDENFYGHEQRIGELEDNPPEGVGIASIEVTGTTMTFTMTDATTRGPFPLPYAVFRFTDELVHGVTYQPLDMFVVQQGNPVTDGLYMVLSSYTSPPATTEDPNPAFDPDVQETDGDPILLKMFGTTVGKRIYGEEYEDFQVSATHVGGYTRVMIFGNTDITEGAVTFTDPTVDTVGWPTPPEYGTEFKFRNGGDVPLLFSGPINFQPGHTGLVEPGGVVLLTYTVGGSFDAEGDFLLGTL